jgi:SAM-dependent methyltransferase
VARTADGVLDALTGARRPVAEWAREPLAPGSVLLHPTHDEPPAGAPNSADALLLQLVLHRCDDVEAVFAAARSVLRPGGTLVIVTPSAVLRTLDDLRWRSVLRPVRRGPWRHRAALDSVGWLLAAADFAVLGDDRAPYGLPLPDAGSARRAADRLPEAGLWPDLDAAARTALAGELARRAGPDVRVPVPLRRLVARR